MMTLTSTVAEDDDMRRWGLVSKTLTEWRAGTAGTALA